MDPLSISASIAALLDVANEVLKYIASVKNAPSERKLLVVEASNLLPLLYSLQACLANADDDHSWFDGIKQVGVKDGPLDQAHKALQSLAAKVLLCGRTPAPLRDVYTC